MTSGAAAVAELAGVSFRYPGGPPVLEDVDLTITAGDFLGIVGPNGGGKTTLLKLLLGLLKPRRGTVRVFGRRPSAVRHRIGYVPQHAGIDPTVPANALDVVLMGRLHGASWGPRFAAADVEAALAALARTGTAELARRPIAAMSGGQRQRVLIARALAADAELLLLDEPTTGVDLHMEREVVELLERLNETLPIVMVSHDVALVSAVLGRVACVNRRLSLHAARELSPDGLAELYDGRMAAVEDAAGDCPAHPPAGRQHPLAAAQKPGPGRAGS